MKSLLLEEFGSNKRFNGRGVKTNKARIGKVIELKYTEHKMYTEKENNINFF